ncbi:hypothetical protein AB1Y20_002823 [Prymnesium parvum]|uniref:PsbB mRNA maturation factor Mbb1, chloroplastic n=1 Tax=Prymnesium parvum TaxID=97485 RepID=A0AB34J9P8_PRYPA
MRLIPALLPLLIPTTSDGLLLTRPPLCSTSAPVSTLNGDTMLAMARTTKTEQTVRNIVLRGFSSSTRHVVAPSSPSAPAPAPPPHKRLSTVQQEGEFVLSENVLKMGPPELYEYSKRLVQTRQHPEAIAALERLLGLQPDDGKAWMQLVRVYKQTRKAKKAESTLRQAIDACPHNALLRQALADLCRKQKRYDEAREHFRRAMLIDPKMQSIYDSWGRMELSLGRHAVAASLISRGITIKPTARLYHALAVVQDTRGKTKEARIACASGLQLPDEGTNPQLLHALGMIEARAGEVRRARKSFLLAVEATPSFTMAHLALGQLEEQLGNHEAARRHYREGATTMQPADRGLVAGRRGAVQLWQAWARMERRLGRPVAALRLYERASRWYASDEQLLIEWAKLLAAQDEFDEARALYEKLRSFPQPRPYAYQCYALLEQAADRPLEARAMFKAGAALNPTTTKAREEMVPLLHAWAVFEWKQGNRSAARKLFERAEAAAPSPCGWLYQWHARFEADGGNMVLARHYYARAANAAPRDSSVWRMWADLEQSLNQTHSASVFLRRSVELEAEEWLCLDEGGSPLRRRQVR